MAGSFAVWRLLRYGACWPLHDIVITNIVWCIAYKREVGRGVLYCPITVQQYWLTLYGGAVLLCTTLRHGDPPPRYLTETPAPHRYLGGSPPVV